jgi:hypothetical protein
MTTATRITHLCAPCAEGRGLEVDTGRLVLAVCADCGLRTRCLVTVRPA